MKACLARTPSPPIIRDGEGSQKKDVRCFHRHEHVFPEGRQLPPSYYYFRSTVTVRIYTASHKYVLRSLALLARSDDILEAVYSDRRMLQRQVPTRVRSLNRQPDILGSYSHSFKLVQHARRLADLL